MRYDSGLTLMQILVIGGVVAILAGIVLPSFVKARRQSQQYSCISNLRIVDAAKEQWAAVAKKSDGDPIITASVNRFIKGNTPGYCPAGGRYIYRNIGSDPICTGVTVSVHAFAG